jgi:hypothetical protein
LERLCPIQKSHGARIAPRAIVAMRYPRILRPALKRKGN